MNLNALRKEKRKSIQQAELQARDAQIQDHQKRYNQVFAPLIAMLKAKGGKASFPLSELHEIQRNAGTYFIRFGREGERVTVQMVTSSGEPLDSRVFIWPWVKAKFSRLKASIAPKLKLNKLFGATAGALLLIAALSAHADTAIAISRVPLFSAQLATGLANSPIKALPTMGQTGTLIILGTGITGSPAGCVVTLLSGTQSQLSTSSLASVAFTPGSSIQSFPVSFASGTYGDDVQAQFSCTTYPSAGSLWVTLATDSVSAVSLGTSAGKAKVGQPNTLASTTATADQVITTYTVTAGKTLYLLGFDCNARLTTYAATATYFGDCSLETPSGTKLYTQMVTGTGQSIPMPELPMPEPLPIPGGTVIRVVCTPSAVTPFTWRANIIGYER